MAAVCAFLFADVFCNKQCIGREDFSVVYLRVPTREVIITTGVISSIENNGGYWSQKHGIIGVLMMMMSSLPWGRTVMVLSFLTCHRRLGKCGWVGGFPLPSSTGNLTWTACLMPHILMGYILYRYFFSQTMVYYWAFINMLSGALQSHVCSYPGDDTWIGLWNLLCYS